MMKIGYTPWTWLLDEENYDEEAFPSIKRNFEQSLRELVDLGYDAVDNFNAIVPAYEKCPEEFEALLRRYPIEFVNIYHYMTTDFDHDLAMAERCCKFLRANGASLMNIQVPWTVGPRGTRASQQELDEAVRKLGIMNKLVRKHGIDMCLHPHFGTVIYWEDQIDYALVEQTAGPMYLCMDTAHTQLAGMDTVKIFAKYVEKIRYVHLKDLDPEPVPDEPMRAFRALGEGIVDFKGVFNVLKRGGYEGVLCVEVDYPRVCGYESAMVSRSYIHRVLGL